MKKRRLRPCIKTTLEILIIVLIGIIGTFYLLFAIVDNHFRIVDSYNQEIMDAKK